VQCYPYHINIQIDHKKFKSDNWKFDKTLFDKLNKPIGPFDVDERCETNGLNSLLGEYWDEPLKRS